MTRLIYLMDEICTGVEIYYTGRTGGQYLKTAFILCDDYTELASKLFLIKQDADWSDTKGNNRFKTYHDVQLDVQAMIRQSAPQVVTRLGQLHEVMKERRKRRNGFFHSAHLLDLGVVQRNCVEAFCDLLDYGQLLFGEEWARAVENARNLNILELMLRLERKGFSDPAIWPKVSDILSQLPRNHTARLPNKGVHIVKYPEDLHTRVSVVYGGFELRDKLSSLL